MTASPSLLIVGHGTRAAEGAHEFHALADRVRALAPELAVGAGFIELSRPPVSEAVNTLVAQGADDVVAVPLMLLAAGHTKNDIPATLERERASHPGVRFRYGRDLGVRPELLALIDERIAAVVAPEERSSTAVLLVGRGSSDPDANSELFKIARLYYEGRDHPFVETAFVSLAPPSVPDGLERCRRLGAERVVVVPYFLFTGVLERRIRDQSHAFAAASGLDVRVSGYFGPDDRVAALVLERFREASEDGDVRMNCDVCVHRVALPGFEPKVGAPATPHYHPDENGQAGDGHGHEHGHHHPEHGHAHEHGHDHAPHPNAGQRGYLPVAPGEP
jgi:sirohydrochlorin cobaltochelatase